MKKFIPIIGLCALTLLPGCTNNMANRDVYEESGNTINVNNKRNELYREDQLQGTKNISNQYGYVRNQKSPLMNDNTANNNDIGLDREQLANIISKLAAEIPNVNDVAALVTDQEVLVAYQTDTKNRELTADQVKRTALSVVPRYYHVYVSDNKAHIRDVENLANFTSTSKKAREQVNAVIKRMKTSPQGSRINNSEDENGLTPDDKTKTSR
ncbi:YhcN/YlaJ family sporulation lipoprotein [Neobacillus thermocopriae]|uniref:Sporulation protein n=1 Tax=Neobacillus thermocopriae TaxID=1215031 RepID=A0A6B3TQK7_9BACI|nr:YhcN/YlaJ family sporulation lipoprotein [Neobacillus thermocopriae]MED3624578.1 YhcN/YlaJ family sporulation lipoprotein [Neobacillus thermocopriae]MED3712971.1 YhcN/YlaJ family sporulation lipoprotein [Neobacillus thermocopriae]NEX79103.1 sporulation protein [Neobacillus thermocopriae]